MNTDRDTRRTSGQVLTIFSLACLLAVVALMLVGAGRHTRAQTLAEAELRLVLAEGRAPVGQLDADGRPLAPGTPVALLEIPAIGLREVVLEGTSAAVLADGPGHRRDTVLPGQAGMSVLMGRRAGYGGPFAGLPRLRHDDVITVTTGQDASTFTVLGVRHAGDPVPEALAPGRGGLTLLTADGAPFLPADVLYVDAVLTSDVRPTPARAFGAASLTAAEHALAGDDQVVPLVLWLQLVVACACGVVWVRHRLGPWHAWIIGTPTLGAAGLAAADTALRLLPNLL
ncbi:sortase [Catellatospora citrea]|uniref:Sortase n=1 Tax=Catellatospora citrea TaxID=53366 RepID=A0A8J3K9R0_9ACTN|nr:sortase [Catellatospora citrea]RKE11268.1 LPXTG-site transpeptidase (sortase) family protein [Catellatospora citrea]GIF96734.1 sortase [Catellatospora citrea]